MPVSGSASGDVKPQVAEGVRGGQRVSRRFPQVSTRALHHRDDTR